MKKLAILINSMNGGGAERVVSILLDELIYKYEVFLVVLHAGLAYKIPEKVKLYRLGNSSLNTSNFSKTIRLISSGYKYYLFCKKNKIDISLSLLNRANYINLFSKFFGAKHRIIISERATTTEEYPANSVKGKVSRLLIKWLYPHADEIISISKGIEIDLCEVFKINPKKIKTIYNPIDLDNLDKQAHSAEEKKSGEFTFIAIGRLNKSKNFQLLLEAFAKLDYPLARLILLGDGPLWADLNAAIVDLGLEKRVRMLGSINNIFPWLKSADCFVMSSNYEGFGNVILEALGCGKAIIATDCKYGPSEILAEKISPVVINGKFEFEKYGVLVPLNDPTEFSLAMKEMIVNKNRRETYELLGRQRASHFSKNIICSQYLSVLENTVDIF